MDEPDGARRSRRLLGLLLGVLLSPLAAEALARLLLPEQAWLESLVPQQVSDLAVHRPSADPGLLYELAPDTSLEQDGPFGEHRVSINRFGFRGPEPTGEAETRILCLGGSNTYGPGVDDAQTWPARLQQHLEGVEVLNLGVSGWMTRQKAALGEVAVPRWQPDLVLIQLYNTGRRFVLAGDVGPAFARWPQLYREYLEGADPDALIWRSTAWRGLVLGWNRRDQKAISARLYARSVEEDAAALRRFVQGVGELPVVVIFPPAGGQSEVLKGLELPVIDLSTLDQPFGEAGLEIHPGPEVYDWYAARIAEGLEGLGLVAGAR